ncbi:glycoside hydrolase family 16 protein [Methylorubrum sp. SL192]|uniref:glycoside hydrolase family 16 protein n=1 Tax=Methylorubrum sp. SL192 TaxID=2995167 RepID=UPI00227345C3|nr:glycoside hydrolase family 16 protein [Methylorubrum sp. SL192]MCY1641035.1 glycoside hydrolase family 16 protein [Methylorubrum sp. SL192]
MTRKFLVLVGVLLPIEAAAESLPSNIDPADLGLPTFEETWQSLDASEMWRKPAKPTRWRTVHGAGDPTKEAYRTGSAGSIFVDSSFTGVMDGKLLDKPLGLNPFTLDPGKSVTIVGTPVPENLKSIMFGRSYMAGLLTTKFSFSQLFGYFEVKAKIPSGKGMWPAFWLMPVKGQWPANGELDVFEGLGQANEIHTTVHSAPDGKHVQTGKKVVLPFDVGGPGSDWHTYGAAWTAKEIVWYVDRKEVFRTTTPSDMKQVPMYLLLNLAIGGKWGGWPDETTPWPGEFVIQRVSAWKLPG